jgi:hypothetical protein
MPNEVAALRPNQWFEAVVARDPVGGGLLRVLHLEPIPALRMMTVDEQGEFLDSFPIGVPSPIDGRLTDE